MLEQKHPQLPVSVVNQLGLLLLDLVENRRAVLPAQHYTALPDNILKSTFSRYSEYEVVQTSEDLVDFVQPCKMSTSIHLLKSVSIEPRLARGLSSLPGLRPRTDPSGPGRGRPERRGVGLLAAAALFASTSRALQFKQLPFSRVPPLPSCA